MKSYLILTFLIKLLLSSASAFGVGNQGGHKATKWMLSKNPKLGLSNNPSVMFSQTLQRRPSPPRGQPLHLMRSVFSLRGGQTVFDITDTISSGFDWTANLGAPAALIAGTVLATIYDKINNKTLFDAKKSDSKLVIFAKRLNTFLLLSAFILQLVSIFVTVVTGTMLLSITDVNPKMDLSMTSPLGFLKNNFEFEYLTSRITFLQGLLNWLGSIALDFAVADESGSKSLKKFNKTVSVVIGTVILMIVSFYNAHINFYPNYFSMFKHWSKILFQRYLGHWPLRPMTYIIMPATIYSLKLIIESFLAEPDEE